jgi:hypothetical protein
MMKIASRWAEAEVAKSSTKKSEKEGEKDSAVKSFESEQSSLFKEMTEVEKENRVWRFTEAVDEGIFTKAPIFHTASNIVYDDTKVRMLVPDQYQLKLTTTLFWSLKVLLKTKLVKKYLQTQL